MVFYHHILRILSRQANGFPKDANSLVDNVCIRSDDKQMAEIVCQGCFQEEGSDSCRLAQANGGFAASEGVRHVGFPCGAIETCASSISGAVPLPSEVL